MAIAGIPTKEEFEYIRNYILLPFLLDVIEKNKREIELLQTALKPLFLIVTDTLLDRISQDIKGIKQSLRAAQIKVWEMVPSDIALQYGFSCRGYQDTFYLSRNSAKAELSILLTGYVQKLGMDLRH